MREHLEELDFPESAYREGALESLAFAGHLSHPVGMAVHDVGDYSNAPLEPGMVFAVDPMMWVREHRDLRPLRGHRRRHRERSGEPHLPSAAVG